MKITFKPKPSQSSFHKNQFVKQRSHSISTRVSYDQLKSSSGASKHIKNKISSNSDFSDGGTGAQSS